MAGNANSGRRKGDQCKISYAKVRELLSDGTQKNFWLRCLQLAMGEYKHPGTEFPLEPSPQYAKIVADRLESVLASVPYFDEEASALIDIIQKLKDTIAEIKNGKSTDS